MRSRHSCCDEKTWKATRMSIKIIPDGKKDQPEASCRTAGAARGAHYARHPHPARWKLNIIRTDGSPSEDRRVPSDFWYQRGLRFHGSCSGYRRQERRPYAGWFLICVWSAWRKSKRCWHYGWYRGLHIDRRNFHLRTAAQCRTNMAFAVFFCSTVSNELKLLTGRQRTEFPGFPISSLGVIGRHTTTTTPPTF